MKWLIASDIHGSAYYCRKLLDRYEIEQADRMLLLGDILYHGPRNDLPEGYAPKEVISMLNEKKQDIYCIRGNCDTEVDQMVLGFPILADYCMIDCGKQMIYATHGHLYGETNPPLLHQGDILLCGHTHVPKCAEHEHFTYMNPGSISIPKEDSWHGYMILEHDRFIWKDLDGTIQMEYPKNRDIHRGRYNEPAVTEKYRDIHRGRYNEPAASEKYHGNYEPPAGSSDIYGIREKARKHMQMVKSYNNKE